MDFMRAIGISGKSGDMFCRREINRFKYVCVCILVFVNIYIETHTCVRVYMPQHTCGLSGQFVIVSFLLLPSGFQKSTSGLLV